MTENKTTPTLPPMIQSGSEFPALGYSGAPPVGPPPPVPLPNVRAPYEYRSRSQQEFMAYNSGFNDGYVRGYYSGMNTMASQVHQPPYTGRGGPYRGRIRGRGRGRGGGRGGTGRPFKNHTYSKRDDKKEPKEVEGEAEETKRTTASGQAYVLTTTSTVHEPCSGEKGKEEAEEE